MNDLFKNDSPTEQKNSNYTGKPIQFIDKGDHYELIFADDFVSPSSGILTRDQGYSLIVDICNDMKNANHCMELQVFINSYGGEVVALNMILQQMKLFQHTVGIVMGTAMSCGFILLFACDEQYVSEYGTLMYHEMSQFIFNKKNKEIETKVVSAKKWFDLLINQTNIRDILTPEELKLGETSEVYFTGDELIKRHACKNVCDFYNNRKKLPKIERRYTITKGNTLYVLQPNSGRYVRYTNKSVSTYSYSDIINHEEPHKTGDKHGN